MAQPTTSECWQLATALDRAIQLTEWNPTNRGQGAGEERKWSGGLLDGHFVDPEPGLDESVGRVAPDTSLLDGVLRESPAAVWLLGRPGFADVRKKIKRQFTTYRKQRFGDPRAYYWVIGAAAHGLGQMFYRTATRTTPRAPGVEDWQAGIEAVAALKDLEACGVTLSNALREPYTYLPYDWLDRLERALIQASSVSKKPHADEFAIMRECVRAFARSLWIHFDEAPATIVRSFADAVEYRTQALESRHLPEWVEQFRTHSIL